MSSFSKLQGPWDELFPFHVTSIIDDKGGLNISIKQYRKGDLSGQLHFGAHYAYRNFNASDLYGYWLELGQNFLTGLYVAEDSDLLRWATKQSVYDKLDDEVAHYMLVTAEDVLEVLSYEPPAYNDLV
jgi:hypothetical protein